MSDAPVRITNREEAARLTPNQPILTSESLGWQGVMLEYGHSPKSAGGIPDVSTPWHMATFVCQTPTPPKVVRRFEGKQWKDEARVGELVVIPANAGYGLEWDNSADYLLLCFDPQDFAAAIDGSQETHQVEVLPQFSQPDPLFYQLALGLKSVVEAGGQGNRLYAETLSHTLMVHLFQHYTARKLIPKTYSDGFSHAKRQLILDYIQAHLNEDLGLKQLAALLQLSPHYFAHLFKQSMGVAPHQYVIQQRVKRAKQLLKHREFSIADVSYQVGFANQAHLNRHFKRLVGVTPGSFRRG